MVVDCLVLLVVEFLGVRLNLKLLKGFIVVEFLFVCGVLGWFIGVGL